MKPNISPKWLSFIGIVGIFFSLIIVLFLILSLASGSYAKLSSPNYISDTSLETMVFTKQVGNQNLENPVDIKPKEQSVKNIVSQKQAVIRSAMRLKIPKIGVDSAVIPVGLTSDGAMDVPKGPAETAWFNLGPRPGENGSAVIAGHYDWKNNMPAVFNDLDKLRVGDKIFVDDENEATTIFVVREIKIYNRDAVASDVFGLNDAKARLNLITCVGIWDKEENTYSERLVVFADKE